MMLLTGPSRPVQSLAFSPDGTKLYAVHDYVGVHVWDLTTRSVTPLETAEGVRVFGEFVPHPDGRWAFGRFPVPGHLDREDAGVIDLTTRQTRSVNFLGVVGQNVALSPSGRQVATVGHSQYDRQRRAQTPVTRLYGWQMTQAGPKYAWHQDTPDTAEARSVVYLGEDRLVTVEDVPVGPPLFGNTPQEHRLTVRSARGKEEASLAYPEKHIDQVLTSPDGKLVVARLGTSLWVWDAADLARPPTVVARTHTKWLEPEAACFHPSGRYLFLASNGPSVWLLDTETWRPAQKWKWQAGTLRAVAVAADGSLAAAAGPRGCVVVWDLDL